MGRIPRYARAGALEGSRRLALLFGLVALLAACGSSAQGVAYTGRLYSVAQVKRAFSQLGLELRSPQRRASTISFQMWRKVSGVPAGRDGRLVVATRRSAVGNAGSGLRRETSYANVSVSTNSFTREEVRGALSAMRWGTLAQGKPAAHLLIPGESIGVVRMGERRSAVEKALGRGRPNGHGVVSYFSGRLSVIYEFHDAVYPWVNGLATTSAGYITNSGVHVGSPRAALNPLFVTCVDRTACRVQEGPWADALMTSFLLRRGRIVEIGMGPS